LEARALPLIGFGIVISGLAADLAKLPVWIDLVGLVLATIFSLRIVVPIASKKRKEKLGRVKADKALGQ
jgi:membrane protein implicated in regulation of membrane protease activity